MTASLSMILMIVVTMMPRHPQMANEHCDDNKEHPIITFEAKQRQ